MTGTDRPAGRPTKLLGDTISEAGIVAPPNARPQAMVAEAAA